MKRIVEGGLLVALIATLAACQPVDREEEDVSPGITAIRDQFIEAYNRHDAAAVAALYTDDAVFVSPDGTELNGREQIQRDLEGFFLDTQPQLTASATATEGSGDLGWELGSYQLELQLPGEPLPGEPPPLGAEPIGEPAAATQPGTAAQPSTAAQPGVAAPPGQPPIGAPQTHNEEGRYLIVLERGDDDAWLIRAHVSHPGEPAAAMSPQQPVTDPMAPGQAAPLEPPPATGPGTAEPAQTRPEAAAPPTAAEPAADADPAEDDLEPRPEDDGGSPER